MYRIALMGALCIMLSQQQNYACDACGCGIAGSGIGVMTSYRNNFVRLSWQSARYESLAEYGSGSSDHFQIVDLAGRYYLSDRLKVTMNLPYRINHRVNTNENTLRNGLGDVRITANYSWLNNWLNKDGSSLLFETGLGLKLPTGTYDPDIHDSNLPENFNLGQGNLGIVFEPTLVYSRQRWGIALSSSAQINTASADGYKFGHQWISGLNFFHEFNIGKVEIIPQLGANGEYISRDRYKNDNYVHGTGGKGLFANAGLNIQQDSWLVGIQYSVPLRQNFSQGEVESKNRLAVQLSYIF